MFQKMLIHDTITQTISLDNELFVVRKAVRLTP